MRYAVTVSQVFRRTAKSRWDINRVNTGLQTMNENVVRNITDDQRLVVKRHKGTCL